MAFFLTPIKDKRPSSSVSLLGIFARKFLLFWSLFFFSFSLAHAQEIELTLQTSEDTIVKGQSFTLILTAKSKNQQQISLSQIRIEGIEDFQEKGVKNATQMSIINGRVATVFDQQHTLTPLKEGSFQLTAYAGNDKSNTLTITVQSAQQKAISQAKKEGEKEKILQKNTEEEKGMEVFLPGLFWWILGGMFFFFFLTLFFLLLPSKKSPSPPLSRKM